MVRWAGPRTAAKSEMSENARSDIQTASIWKVVTTYNCPATNLRRGISPVAKADFKKKSTLFIVQQSADN
jgi:hypothetical protein